ncbi:MAG: fructose-bisphosphate aldolase class I [Candidatus Andersenbacteria bacterium CG10_big_fil_rev_8_21_14_0_10_54_11]|uniref:fructose-bisphosphate aldolase n=1 Tax=Candidatus Andersenbacteria bacterium CG10_big_fil_rev_8_21_14_0_10_54_11 TaxID=1974485 RepID=A0A2M6X084_9BACT|nr:MAG: fructose-bisphosphate aldolase class I [Candidatus Andersenbacteria bacterium CG10_big_fil_rev_8_21_14_0_10_54_11]
MARIPLSDTVAALFTPGKGILAADESVRTAGKRLRAVGAADSAEMRRQYRELFFTAPGMAAYLSGVILFAETFHQATSSGIPFVRLLAEHRVLPGIKVDLGTVAMPNFPDETVTEGIDGLAGRLMQYAAAGARFTKWRAVVRIGGELPSATCLTANAHLLARFAAESQAAGLVPIVEPEVLLEGSHSIAEAEAETERTLRAVFEQLAAYRIDLRGAVLKTSMVVPGRESGEPMVPGHVARATVRVLQRAVPEEMGGVVFLSGGQTPVQATENLQAIAALGPHRWPVTFSYARALQEEALAVWRGRTEAAAAAQRAFMRRLQLAAAAQSGSYSAGLETGREERT